MPYDEDELPWLNSMKWWWRMDELDGNSVVGWRRIWDVNLYVSLGWGEEEEDEIWLPPFTWCIYIYICKFI